MSLVKVELFKSPAFLPGDEGEHRTAIQAQMNAFMVPILPQDVLSLELRYVSDGKYGERYTYIGHITYFVP